MGRLIHVRGGRSVADAELKSRQGRRGDVRVSVLGVSELNPGGGLCAVVF